MPKKALTINGTAGPSSEGTITMKLYDRIRADILAGVFQPEQKLKINDIVKKYEASTSPVREALNLLTSFGFVDRVENKGFQVKSVSCAEFDDILRVRCWVEERALRESILLGDAIWEENIALALFRLERAANSAEHNIDWDLRHKEFHNSLISGCGSPVLLKYCEYLHEQNIRYRQLAGSMSATLRDTSKEHRDISAATLERDGEQAAELLIAHYNTTGHYLRMRLFSV